MLRIWTKGVVTAQNASASSAINSSEPERMASNRACVCGSPRRVHAAANSSTGTWCICSAKWMAERMLRRDDHDIDEAARFATALFLGGVRALPHVGTTPGTDRPA